ncbi:MAG: phosphoribosylanthranilate isomerase [Alphaproteobacteria bacterium]|nr:MAG: phosphoribosylanthranilate isomerase [Alphaproteobacteria bacterium]
MPMPPVKICGVSNDEAIVAAAHGGATFVGLVFFSASPRHLGVEEAAKLAGTARSLGLKTVGVFVDPDDALLAETVACCDLLQLHGQETPERLAEIRTCHARPLIKAIPVAAAGDLLRISDYETCADRLLFDAKPPADAVLPGGAGRRFDWSLLAEIPADLRQRCLLSGGLDPNNVTAAIRAAPGFGLDVSSGVEDKPGVKSPAKIRAFLKAVRRAATMDETS